MGINLSSGQSCPLRLGVKAADLGAADAISIKQALLTRSDASTQDLTPASPGHFLVQEARAVNPAVESTVGNAGAVYGAGGGTGGKNIQTLTMTANVPAGIQAGSFVRSKRAGARGVVYKVDSVAGADLIVFAKQTNFDILADDTIEKVDPEYWYRKTLTVQYADLQAKVSNLEVEYDSVLAGNDPVVTVEIDERSKEHFSPATNASAIKVM